MKYIADVKLSAAWPKWEDLVLKVSNHNRATWESWSHQFCWNCQDELVNNGHQTTKFCWFGNIILVFIYLYVIYFTVNLKLWVEFKGYRNVMLPIYTVIGFILGSNAYFLTILFEFVWIEKVKSLAVAQGWKKKCK